MSEKSRGIENLHLERFVGAGEYNIPEVLPCTSIHTNTLYGSILEASIKTGVQKQNICKCCKGERKTAGGFIWKYRG